MTNTPLDLLGVPLDMGAKNLGVSMGADTLRYQHITDKLQVAGFDITDRGNIACVDRKDAVMGNPRLRYLDEIVRVNTAVARTTEAIVGEGHKVAVLGGDHSICLGAVAGASTALHGNIGLIYFDAHGDMNTDATTRTGNIHGMHLASLLGFGTPELAELHGAQPKIAKPNLLHIGGCDFDQAETDFVERENIQAFSMLDLMKHGLAPLLSMIDTLAAQVDHLWVSLDLDSIDATYAPGAGMPNMKGLTYREIAAIAHYIGQTGKVVGVDVVEYNPLQDIQGKTAELAIELIATFYGKQYSWYTQYMAHNAIG